MQLAALSALVSAAVITAVDFYIGYDDDGKFVYRCDGVLVVAN